MYSDEQRTSISLKNTIIQFLFILLFIFLLMWIFPTKSFINESIDPFKNQIFNDNLTIMKDAAKDYFTLERLPEEVGDSVTLTLGEMLSEKLLVTFVDSNNNKCDENLSYVEVTKYENEYVMKVYLSCSDNQDYILVYMGCYDYCSTFICEKEEESVTRPSITIPTTPDEPVVPDEPVEYKCQYLKVTDGYYSDWSSWGTFTTTQLFENDLTDVNTEVRSEQTLIGYNVTTADDPTKPIYKTYLVESGSETTTICSATSTSYQYTEWAISSTSYKYYGSLSDSDTVKYQWLSSGIDYSCTGCGDGLYNIYNVYKREKVLVETCTAYETVVTPTYTEKQVIIGYEQIVTREPVYTTSSTTYYQSRTRTLTEGTEDYQWSDCDDQDLLNQGYSIVQKVEK